MYLTINVLEEFYDAVVKKFSKQIFTKFTKEEVSEKNLFAENKDNNKVIPLRKFWSIKDKNGNLLFREFISKNENLNNFYLFDVYTYRTSKYIPKKNVLDKKISVKKSSINNESDFISVKDDALGIFLIYLGYKNDDLNIRFKNFQTQHISPEDQLHQSRLKQKPSSDSYKLDEVMKAKKRKVSFNEFAKRFENTEWWYYIRAYNNYGEFAEDENYWPLAKLILRFNSIKENKLIVDLENTNYPHHHNFRGELEFQFSQSSNIVLNLLTTSPTFHRFLNIVLMVEGDVTKFFLGQFINIERENSHVVSGSVIIERIDENKHINPLPERKKIPKQDIYNEDIDGISKYILQFLSDKSQNFRRTPNLLQSSLDGLKEWHKKRGVKFKDDTQST